MSMNNRIMENLPCKQNKCSLIKGVRFFRELRQVLPETVEPVKLGNSSRGYRGSCVLKPYLVNDFEELE